MILGEDEPLPSQHKKLSRSRCMKAVVNPKKSLLHSDLSGARPQHHSPRREPFPRAPLLLHQSYKPFPCLLLKIKTQKNVNSATISTNLSKAYIGRLQYNAQFSPHLFFSFFSISLSSERLPSMLPTSEWQTREPCEGQF